MKIYIIYMTNNSKANTSTIKLYNSYEKALIDVYKLNEKATKKQRWVVCKKPIEVQ